MSVTFSIGNLKKHISLLLLIAFLLPSLGFVGSVNSTSQQETTSHKSVAWGFTCITTTGNIYPAFSSLYTYDFARKISKLLGQHGYTTDLQNNPTELSVIEQSFENAEVFFFIGHGAPNAIGLTDSKCNFV